jgi:hypothetical protein
MANITASLKDWSTTESSNQPDNTDSATIAGDLRAIQAGVRNESSTDTIASASTTDLGTKAAGFLTISGTTTITSFGTLSAGMSKTVLFSGVLTLTHNATSLILPGAENITTAAGDVAIFRSLGSGNWRCVAYQKASGAPISLTSPGPIGSVTPAPGAFTTLAVNGSATIGDAAEDTVSVQGATWTFSAVGTKIKGDFSDATHANRTIFQSTVTNGASHVGAIPNGTSESASWRAYNNATLTNASFFSMGMSATAALIEAERNGSGTYLPIEFYTNGTKQASLDTSGNFRMVGSGGLGYGTGSGGAVTQETSKSTSVTINRLTGQITMNNASLNASTGIAFTVNNSACSATDVPLVVISSGAASAVSYLLNVTAVANGSFRITLRNLSGGALSEAVVINFAIIKGAIA